MALFPSAGGMSRCLSPCGFSIALVADTTSQTRMKQVVQ